jgi:carboxyl-terminal processing protease
MIRSNWVRASLGFAFLWVLAFTTFSKDNPAPAQDTTDTHAPFALETFDAVWQKIYDHHFDTNFHGYDWKKIREQFRPRAAHARDTAQLRDIIQEMIDLLHVSHMAIVPGELTEMMQSKGGKEDPSVEQASDEDSGTVGLEVRFLGHDLVVTHVEPGLPADRAGVRTGWIIKRIADTSTEKFFPKALSKLDEARRQFLAWRAAAHKLLGEPDSALAIEFVDGQNKTRTLTLKRVRGPGEAVQFGSLPVLYSHFSSTELRPATGRRIGLIRFDIWLLPTAIAFNKAMDEFRDANGIIIDLRGNIGGMVGMIIGSAGHFLKEPATLGSMIARDNTFQLPANPRFVGASGQPVTPYSGPVAILTDEITASASEVFTGGMQELGRVRVFGRRTSGQALPAMLDDLPNGDAFYHPISDFVTPKGVRFEGRGVIPDEEISLTRGDLLAGKDVDVERAVNWIQKRAGK